MPLSLHHLDQAPSSGTHRKTVKKFARTLGEYAKQRFAVVGEVEGVRTAAVGEQHLRTPPDPASPGGLAWEAARAGRTMWGGGWRTAWFVGDVAVPKAAAGRKLWLAFDTDMVKREGLLFVEGEARGVYSPFHSVIHFANAKASKKLACGEPLRVAVEMYGGNAFPGDMPEQDLGEIAPTLYRGWHLLAEREDVSGFYFDLQALIGLREVTDADSLVHHAATRAMAEVMGLVIQLPGEVDESEWRPQLDKARDVMRPVLEAHNGTLAPTVALVGHSHIDTAWHWPVAETRRKCARTFSSVLNLMEQYPEMTFLQSSAVHTQMVKDDYPELFERIKTQVKAGRWEPNGGMWVEPDCNLTGGESLVRQFLVGQRLTREWFGYTSDTMWQPDVFGYSAALPQILRGCGIEFFCTTKLSWNDTTRFPRDTFHWEGLDGSTVLAHFQIIQGTPDPVTLCELWHKHVIYKDVQDRVLFPYGHGDGGGGPKHEMLELARRLTDLQGVPKTRHTTASKFLRGLRDDLADRLPLYSGELYLEMHRGTLTSIAKIKRGNRKCEAAIRDAEMLHVMAAADTNRRDLSGPDRGEDAADVKQILDALWRRLLTNQFHDILPGSSIAQVNDEAIADFDAMEAELGALNSQLLTQLATNAGGTLTPPMPAAPMPAAPVTVFNSLSWPRGGTLRLAGEPPVDAAALTQPITDPAGYGYTLVYAANLPPLCVSPLTQAPPPSNPFTLADDDRTVTTPHLTARFDDRGRIVSLLYKGAGSQGEPAREIVHGGGCLNRLVCGQDTPHTFDNWDIDIDQSRNMRDDARLLSREVVANGPLQLRIRQCVQVGRNSKLIQDVVFHLDRPMVEFDSVIDWDENHILLQAEFDLAVAAREATHEVQFGHLRRPMHDNTAFDAAQFEVAQQRWSDVSEAAFGVALLNDCKYAVSAQTRRLHGLRRHGSHPDLANDATAPFTDAGATLGLTLMKSGRRPDPRGDRGTHRFRYAILPHEGPASVESVVRPAYEFNLDPLWSPTPGSSQSRGSQPLLTLDTPDLIVEAVKRAEDSDATIVRLYEAAGRSGTARITLPERFTRAHTTNLLEEQAEALEVRRGTISISYRPFQLFTLKVD